MATIDKAALIEVLRDELAGWPIGSGYYGTQVGTDEAREMAHAALPVIAAGLLAPLRELHRECDWMSRTPGRCWHDGRGYPCPTVRLLDQIEADAKGDER